MGRKRVEKTSTSIPVQTNQKFYCFRCGSAFGRQKGFFPVSHSPMYRGTGYLPICNDCVEEVYEGYLAKFRDERAAMKRLCMKLDLYYNDTIYSAVERSVGVNSKVRNYIGKTNLIRYIDKTYDDTIIEDERAAASQKTVTAQIADNANLTETIEVPENVIQFWGPGFSPERYLQLEERYQYWVSELPKGIVLDIGTKALLRQIVNAELEVNRLREAGESIDKAQKTLQDLLGSALLKPAQQKEQPDAELENMPLGVGIQKWELKRPLPETPPELKDQSGMIKNITTWFLGHASKMVGLKNSYCKLYEDAIAKLRVERPDLDEEDDDTLLFDIFGGYGDEESGAANGDG